MANWHMIERLPGGHRLFRQSGAASMNIAVADDSGATPPDTADGILWLDFSRSIDSERAAPVLNGQGEAFRIMVTNADSLILSDKYGFRLADNDGRLYRAVRVDS